MKTKRIISICMQVLLLIGIFSAVVYYVQHRSVNNVDVNQYATSDVVYADGTTAHFDDKSFGAVNRGDVVTVHINLPEEPLRQQPTLCFFIYHSVTEVWCGDVLLDSYGADINARGDFVGGKRFLVALPDEAMGGEITIILHAAEDNAFNQIEDLELYSAKDAYQYIIDGDPTSFWVSIPLLVFGGVALIAFLCGGSYDRQRRKGIYLALFAIQISIWMLGNNGILTIYGMTGYFVSLMEYFGAFSVAIPILLYAWESEEKGWFKKALATAAIVNTAYFAFATILNFTNIAHYSATLLISNILTFLSGLFLLAFAIRMKANGRRSDGIFFNGLLILFITGLYELLSLNVKKYLVSMYDVSIQPVLPFGIAAFLVYMVISYFCEVKDSERELITAQMESDNLSKTLAEIPTGICRIIPNEDLTIIAANSIFYYLIGYRGDAISAKGPKSAYAHLSDEGRAYLQNKVNEVMLADKRVGEFEFDTIDVDTKPLSLLIRYSCSMEKDRIITANVIDITDRRRMEDELRIREEEYRLAIEASDHYYFKYDAATKTCTHMFDSEKLFGISEKVEGIPESLVELGVCAPESVDEYRKAFHMFADGVPSGDFIFHLQNIKTHIFRWYSGSYRTVFDVNGTPLHAIAAFKDVTEQREKEIAYNIHKQQIESRSANEINYFELNLTTGVCYYSYGTRARQLSEASSSNWDQMLEFAMQNYVHPGDRTALTDFLSINHLLKMYERGVTSAVHEYRGNMPDGRVRWLHATVNITADERTHEVRAYCLTEDIEEEKAKELEQQLEKQRSQYYEDAYDKLASSVMYGVCKYSADDNLTIIFANDIFYQMHGYASQAEAVAAGFTGILFATPPFGKDIVRAAHRKYTEEKTSQLFETEYPSIDADGNRIWILCRGVYSPEEGIFNASVLNITDRKNAEEQLRVSEERYRLALAQSGKVFFFFDVPSRTMHLSNELAQAFGLPTEVDNMPDNFISQGLVEPQSVENYRRFYEEIYAGKPTGSTIISCHMRSAPDVVLWYKIAFTSVFNARGVPQSAVITYEDLQEERANKIAGAWKQLNLLSVPESKYAVTEYNLTQNRILSQEGGLFEKMPDFMTGYDEVNDFVLDHFIYDEDVADYRRFLDRSRALAMFKEGKTEDTIEYRSMQAGSSPRWTSTSIQMIQDPYSGDVLAQLLFTDIHAEKSGQIEMAQNFEELKKELENSRIKVMINQMQPHFLYNALSAIQTIVKTDPDYAYRLIYDFTVHLRSSIKALSSDAPIPFIDELKNIKAYLNIEQMRFGDSLKVKYEIDCDHFSVIPLSIQPLAENAARHGVYPKGDDGGTVTIRTYETVDAYVVEVEDDGVGFDFNEALEKSGDSVGLKSLIFRLKSLMNADVTINSKLGVGTKVTVTIPKESE